MGYTAFHFMNEQNLANPLDPWAFCLLPNHVRGENVYPIIFATN